MGIGVSYTGYDGATRHSVAQGAADLPRIMGGLPARRATAPASPRVGDRLAAPQQDPVDGPLIGIEGNDSPRPDGQFRAIGTRGGWRLPFSRTEIEVKPSIVMGCNEVTLTKLQYDVIFSEKGLAKGRTEERVVWEKSFFVLAEDIAKSVASGKFAVRLFAQNVADDPVHPMPTAFAFGSDADLDTYNEAYNRFDCNYDESGNVLPDPPVKVIAIEAGARPEGGS